LIFEPSHWLPEGAPCSPCSPCSPSPLVCLRRMNAFVSTDGKIIAKHTNHLCHIEQASTPGARRAIETATGMIERERGAERGGGRKEKRRMEEVQNKVVWHLHFMCAVFNGLC